VPAMRVGLVRSGLELFDSASAAAGGENALPGFAQPDRRGRRLSPEVDG